MSDVNYMTICHAAESVIDFNREKIKITKIKRRGDENNDKRK